MLIILFAISSSVIVVGIMLTRYAVKPFAILAAVADKIGLGQLDTPVPILGSQEAAALGTAMQRMRIELKELYGELEQKVADRTFALSNPNELIEIEVSERKRAEEVLKNHVGFGNVQSRTARIRPHRDPRSARAATHGIQLHPTVGAVL